MIGQTLGHYRVLEQIGAGGMGVVYRAFDERLERDVALKVLPAGVLSDEAARRRFRNEALTLSKLNHPNIESVYDFDTQDGVDFLVMELIPGESLAQKLAGGGLPEADVLAVAGQIAEGLTAAHEAGVVHRDLKPANIRVTPEGRVKILDFGLAKFLRPELEPARAETLTQSRSVAGTLPYMAPEQLLGEKVDHRADIFALGGVLYEMTTGQRPFREELSPRLIDAILNRAPASPRELNHRIAPEVERMILKCLEKRPENRYQSVKELSVDLRRRARDSEPGLARPISAAQSRRSRIYPVAAGLIVVLLGVVLLLHERGKSRRISEWLAMVEPAVAAGRFDEVFEKLQSSGMDLRDSRLAPLAKRVAADLSLETDPPGAAASITRVQPVATFAQHRSMTLGATPVAAHRLIAGEYLVQLRSAGSNPLEFLVVLGPGQQVRLSRKLLPPTSENNGMVLVDNGPAFFMGRHEVRNDQFLKFVAAGGYRNASLWPSTTPLSRLVDRTGVPGPRFWSGGAPPADKQNHPVVGVSWYEASAYARWAGRELPTADQWWRAALGSTAGVFPWGRDARNAEIRANFGLLGARPVESYPMGISPFGCYDMAGNVREWLRDAAADGRRRLVVGGSWQDPAYMFERAHEEAYDPAFASEAVGLRVVK